MDSNVEQSRVHADQLTLFPRKPRDVCQGMGLNWLAAQQLYKLELLSFDPMTVKVLNEGQEAELGFLGSLVIGGCDRGMIEYLIKDLKKPYQYRLDRIFYHWLSQQWQTFPEIEDPEESNGEDSFSNWVDVLIENEDKEQLLSIKETIEEAIIKIKSGDERKLLTENEHPAKAFLEATREKRALTSENMPEMISIPYSEMIKLGKEKPGE